MSDPAADAAPIVIHKSAFGLFLIWLVGFALTALLILAAAAAAATKAAYIYGAIAGVVLVATIIQAYVYNLSTVVLTATALRFTNWITIAYSNAAICEWRQVTDVDVKKGGIFSQLGDFGTLLVQTAGTERNLRIPMIPNVERVRDLIAAQADAAVTPVKETT
jgi:hypothetical protein